MGLADARAAEDSARLGLTQVRERLDGLATAAREVALRETELAHAKEQARTAESPYRDSLRQRVATLEKRVLAAREARVERRSLRILESRLLFALELARQDLERSGVHHSLPLLDVSIATPCPAKWEEMEGDGDMRFCADCQKHVYNLTMMSQEEAQAVLHVSKESPACIRMYRRTDGTLLTQDCPVGVRRHRFWRRTTGLAAAGILAALGAAAYAELTKRAEVPAHCATSGAASTYRR